MSTRHLYTPAEIALVRQRYGTTTAAELARLIHGTPRAARSIYHLACRLKLQRWPRLPRRLLGQVKKLHARGLHDTAIGRALNLPRRTVTYLRQRRLRLPRNEAAILQAQRRGLKAQFRTLGIRTGGELRQLSYRRYAEENGWPAELRPREVQILNLLAATGVPMTKRQLAEGIGMRTDRIGGNGRPEYLKSRSGGGTYTSSLVRTGYLTRLQKAYTVRGRGKGRSQDLYCLGPAALAILEARRCSEESSR